MRRPLFWVLAGASAVAGALAWYSYRKRKEIVQWITENPLAAMKAGRAAMFSDTPAPTEVPVPMPKDISSAGLAFIANYEKYRANLYNDAGGNATIGYGHLVHLGGIDGSESAEFRAGISKVRAIELLKQDAAVAVAAVRRYVTVALTQAQFDALVSFAFNVGVGGFKSSTALKDVNAGNFESVPADLLRWNKSGGVVLAGLTARRTDEGSAFA